MMINYETVLVGSRCLLVPYRKEHVFQYHRWMQDPALLEATGSEPLSLQEEYDMQISWRDDPEKCTFIVLSREKVPKECRLVVHEAENNNESDFATQDDKFICQTLSAMAGDVNLFLSDGEVEQQNEGGVDGETNPVEEQQQALYEQAELDIMVAEASCQRNGIGREACCMMMLYAARNLSIRRFFCKINEDNESSLSLFRKLGFKQCAYAACFRQIELELKEETPEEMSNTLVRFLGRQELVSFRCPLADEYNDGTDDSLWQLRTVNKQLRSVD